ncbi:MAG: hypothetical protein M5T61_14405 [Acidimicrobiia bacterium]|nr:hypothetical protein [Acidimicrobiia bacterium]
MNTGTDYVEIFESLDDYRKWLTGHHPDVGLLEKAYLPGSEVYDRLRGDLEILQRDNTRLVDVEHRMEVDVVSVRDGVVNLSVVEHATALQLIGVGGDVLDEQRLADVTRYTGYLVVASDGVWRIGALERLVDEGAVQL